MPLAARSRRLGKGQCPLPPRRTDEPDRRDTIILDAVVFDVQRDPRPSLHLCTLKLLLIKKFPASRHNDHGGDTVAPLAQVRGLAKDMDMIPQQPLIIEGDDLRDIAPLRSHGCGGLLLRRGEGRAKQHCEEA